MPPAVGLQDLTIGLVGDVGDLVELVQAHEGVRVARDSRSVLEHELTDVLCSLLVIADRCGVDLEAAFTRTMDAFDGTLAHPGGGNEPWSRSRHKAGTHAWRLPLYGRDMEEARSVLERFERIESMRRANAGPVELLEELRALLREAEAWAREEGGDAGSSAAGRLRAALARDMIDA